MKLFKSILFSIAVVVLLTILIVSVYSVSNYLFTYIVPIADKGLTGLASGLTAILVVFTILQSYLLYGIANTLKKVMIG